MGYVLISPCRNEAKYMRKTLDSVIGQTITPAKWVIVDDGSTDDTPNILSEYADKYDWIEVVKRQDRGARSVGPGVIQAFYDGLNTLDLNQYDYLCKLDLDLILPPRYFETLINRMQENPRIGTCSGKPYMQLADGQILPEKSDDEVSVGASKFYRMTCFNEVGGFVRQVMWDAIDCHRCRMLGWIACSWDDEELRFIHLRPMGSSHKGILTGRLRHGFGQYYMGTGLLYVTAAAVNRLAHPPYLIGALALMWGYIKSMLMQNERYPDKEFINFIRRYQRRALIVGKKRAIAEINRRQQVVWEERHHES